MKKKPIIYVIALLVAVSAIALVVFTGLGRTGCDSSGESSYFVTVVRADGARIANHANLYEDTLGESAADIVNMLANEGGIHAFEVAGSTISIMMNPSDWGGRIRPNVLKNDDGRWVSGEPLVNPQP